jgi:hypothetical protein
MFLWGKLGGEDVTHYALLIDNIRYASWQQSNGREDAVKLSDPAPCIAQ